jgi:hypothetical protein
MDLVSDVLMVLIIVCVPMIDPLMMLFYVPPALIGKTPGRAALYGAFSGVIYLGVDRALFGPPRQPIYLMGRLAACVVAATAIRLLINLFHRKTEASAPVHSEDHGRADAAP